MNRQSSEDYQTGSWDILILKGKEWDKWETVEKADGARSKSCSFFKKYILALASVTWFVVASSCTPEGFSSRSGHVFLQNQFLKKH